jgi:hypothetical protein
MTSLHYSADAGLVVTAHPDGRVRLWDPRQRDAVGAAGDLLGNAHAQVGAYYAGKEAHWVAQARFHPVTGPIFASCDYDGAVKVGKQQSQCLLPSALTLAASYRAGVGSPRGQRAAGVGRGARGQGAVRGLGDLRGGGGGEGDVGGVRLYREELTVDALRHELEGYAYT